MTGYFVTHCIIIICDPFIACSHSNPIKLCRGPNSRYYYMYCWYFNNIIHSMITMYNCALAALYTAVSRVYVHYICSFISIILSCLLKYIDNVVLYCSSGNDRIPSGTRRGFTTIYWNCDNPCLGKHPHAHQVRHSWGIVIT
jgi:hypothetical protein